MLEQIAHRLNLFAVENCSSISDDGSCQTNLPEAVASPEVVQSVLGIIFAIIGTAAVIIIIVAGLQFITGQGDPQQIKTARNTIIWALIGLGIAVSAEVIIYVVIGRL